MKRLVLFLLRLYKKWISPLLPQSCRFVPTCSMYAEEAFKKYGFFKAAALSMKRLSKCHPMHPGGLDLP